MLSKFPGISRVSNNNKRDTEIETLIYNAGDYGTNEFLVFYCSGRDFGHPQLGKCHRYL